MAATAKDWINVPGVLSSLGLPGIGGMPGLSTSATSGIASNGARWDFDNSGAWGNNVGGSGTQTNLGGATSASGTAASGGISPLILLAVAVVAILVLRK